MGPAFCVIGCAASREQNPIGSGGARVANAGSNSRTTPGDILESPSRPSPGAKPHVEDRVSTAALRPRPHARSRNVAFLRKAEMAPILAGFLRLPHHENKRVVVSFAMPPKQTLDLLVERRYLRLALCATNSAPRSQLPSEKPCAIFRLSTATGATSRSSYILAPAPIATARLDRLLNFPRFHYRSCHVRQAIHRLGLTRPFHDLVVNADTCSAARPEWLEEL